MANGIFPHPSRRPWPPPLDFDALVALRAALLDRDDPRHADQVPASERAAFEVAPLDWCLRHPEPGRSLVTRAIARLKEPAPRRKPKSGG
jgi:hypothetical protein